MSGVERPVGQTAKDKPRRWKRLAQNVVLFIATFLLCAVVVESILRLSGYGNLTIYEPDPFLYWKPRPNQDCFTKIGHRPVHINSLGTRGPEFRPKKPRGTLRILSLGDSRTFGWGLSEPETYSDRLRQLLQAKCGDSRKVEVINAGVNAWSYAQMQAYFKRTGRRYHPDIVVLAEANLWTQFSARNDPRFVHQFMRRVWLKNFLRHFAIYNYVVEVKLKSFYAEVPGQNSSRWIRTTTRFSRSNNRTIPTRCSGARSTTSVNWLWRATSSLCSSICRFSTNSNPPTPRAP